MVKIEQKTITVWWMSALFCIVVPACSNEREYEMSNLSEFRGLSGEVSVSKDNLGDTTLTINVENIPKSSPDAEDNHYIAWAGNDRETERLGVLNLNGADGVLIATTDLNRFRVFVTRETSADISTPINAPFLQSPFITEK